MPETRSSTRNASFNKRFDSDEPLAARSDTGGEDTDSEFERKVQELQDIRKRYKKKLKKLQEDNSRLRKQLDDRETQVQDRKSNGRNNGGSSKGKIKRLEDEVVQLRKARKRDKKEIEALRKKEIQKEAANLGGHNEDELDEVDDDHKRTLLLRRFADLIYCNTLPDEGEECCVCFEELELNKTSRHVLCDECLKGVSIGADETVKCPECREVHPRDDVEQVQYTETKRWDLLLDVAKAAMVLDSGHRGVEDTSEEERSENFVDDEEEEDDQASTATAGDTNNDVEHGEDEADLDPGPLPSTPPSTSPRKYTELSPAQKRHQMQQLAEERSRKRARR
ncbi:hypothetical protein VNI00_001254 [Paramarasmius palmivorus]|uniref:RING-type domain-containing protein n=1 Tax=Paramarasmius palmivorus TaxID=297713 RepID=A0AAW0EBE8_9AGAR